MPRALHRSLLLAGSIAACCAAGLPVIPAVALNGADASDAPLSFVAKINVGNQTACTGALVDPQWVLTAASCFSSDAKPAAGKPTVTTTVTVGRTDLTKTDGSVLEAVELVPRTDRDLVMVKLAKKITDPNITPVRLATTAAADNEQLTVAGFGRTKTEWVPNKLHTGTFTVRSSATSTVNLDGSDSATVCQGDAGGPALRTVNGTPELVAVNSASWQGGCLGVDPAETRTGAVDTRVDDIASWVAQTAFRVQDDDTGDGIGDLVGIWGDGSAHIYPGDKDKGLSGTNTQLVGGTSWKTTLHLAKGDFTNDGDADVMAVWNDGTMHLYQGNGDGTVKAQTPVTTGGNTWKTLKQLTAGDFNGDGNADILTIWYDGTMHLYPGLGNGQLGGGITVTTGGNTWSTAPQLVAGDFDHDGIADALAVWNDGTLHFYKGQGDGQLAAGKTVTAGGDTWDTIKLMAGTDVDGDGIADVLAIWGDGTMHKYKGQGNGQLGNAGAALPGGASWKTFLQLS
ncbi:FG-GAP-like repeat-containing protein [Streptomyces sp. NPDC096198]|uniref:FG-GAP-like repeat-containing protein n=1 Tax=Streptomyces sp. NPDC096198 TaxID=3366080 RepID=UPI0038075E73